MNGSAVPPGIAPRSGIGRDGSLKGARIPGGMRAGRRMAAMRRRAGWNAQTQPASE